MLTSSLYYSAAISANAPVILRDGQIITDANNKCLPGEAINLSVSNADPGTTHAWKISGDYFKNFAPTTPSVFEGSGAVVINQPTVTYRYIKGDSPSGSAKTVTCTVKVGGTSVAVEDELKVYQPDFTFNALKGGPSSDLSGVILERPQGVMIGSGMDWKNTTVSLPSHGSGTFGFAQTGTVSRTVYNGTASYTLPLAASSGLDHTFPYGGYEKSTGAIVGVDPTPGAGDSPGEAFFGSVRETVDGSIINNKEFTRITPMRFVQNVAHVQIYNNRCLVGSIKYNHLELEC